MAWTLSGTPKTVLVTKEIATEFMEMEPAPHDRGLSERRLAVYEKLFREGKFRPCTWAKTTCKETAGLYRVNGKHTSTLLSGLENLPEFYVTIEEYACDTLEDVAGLYSTFDSQIQSRTAKDIYLSFASTCKELRDVKDRIIMAAAAGIPYYKHHDEMYNRTQPPDRAEMLLENVEFIEWLSEYINEGPSGKEVGYISSARSPHLLKQAVIAAIFGCWQISKQNCNKFWVAVRDETGEEPEAPDRKLAKYLITVTLKGSRVSSNKERASVREVYVKCIHAWNSWRTGKKTNLQYFADKDLPSIK